MRALAVLFVIITLAAIVGVNRADAAEVRAPGLDALASEVVGSPVTVECFAPNEKYAGYVYPRVPIIHLDGTYCGALLNVLRTPAWGSKGYAVSLIGYAALTLSHEAAHLNLDSADEGLVECTAYRNVWQTLRRLPVTWQARQAAYTWSDYSHGSKSPPYRTVC